MNKENEINIIGPYVSNQSSLYTNIISNKFKEMIDSYNDINMFFDKYHGNFNPSPKEISVDKHKVENACFIIEENIKYMRSNQIELFKFAIENEIPFILNILDEFDNSVRLSRIGLEIVIEGNH